MRCNKRTSKFGGEKWPCDLLGNLTGGTSKGYAYDGVTTMALQLDTRRAFGWEGGTFNVSGLQIRDPLAFESEVNQWPGVVTVGVFAHQKAQVCLLATANGVETLEF